MKVFLKKVLWLVSELQPNVFSRLVYNWLDFRNMPPGLHGLKWSPRTTSSKFRDFFGQEKNKIKSSKAKITKHE